MRQRLLALKFYNGNRINLIDFNIGEGNHPVLDYCKIFNKNLGLNQYFMHYINYPHRHKLDERCFSGCCKDCEASVAIIKPHIMTFVSEIKHYTVDMLAALKPDELYRLYQILDDLAHMDTGHHLAALIFKEPDIYKALPIIRSYYNTFFDIHEAHLAQSLLKSGNPWEILKTFPLYSRYNTLIRSQTKAMRITNNSKLAFIGCGAVPVSLILLSHLYGIRSIGMDVSNKKVKLSKKVIKSLGLEKEIEIIHKDDLSLRN